MTILNKQNNSHEFVFIWFIKSHVNSYLLQHNGVSAIYTSLLTSLGNTKKKCPTSY